MTNDELLRLALQGSELEWTDLHRMCLDRGFAERLAGVLECSTTAENDVAIAWVSVLQNLHAGLKVNLPSAISKPTFTRLRVLCADDNEHMLGVMRKSISDAGHYIECVCDGEAAWQRLSTDITAFDVLITDQQMPRLEGLELVARVRRASFAGRIIVVTGMLTPEIEQAFKSLRVDHLFRKTSGMNLGRMVVRALQ